MPRKPTTVCPNAPEPLSRPVAVWRIGVAPLAERLQRGYRVQGAGRSAASRIQAGCWSTQRRRNRRQ